MPTRFVKLLGDSPDDLVYEAALPDGCFAQVRRESVATGWEWTTLTDDRQVIDFGVGLSSREEAAAAITPPLGRPIVWPESRPARTLRGRVADAVMGRVEQSLSSGLWAPYAVRHFLAAVVVAYRDVREGRATSYHERLPDITRMAGGSR
jgi:hypothetical protein